jgi:hypothetical protein
MITKVTLLTFIVYTAASGQEEDSTNRLATLDSSRRFVRWLHPLGSSSIAEASIAFFDQLRTVNTGELRMRFFPFSAQS